MQSMHLMNPIAYHLALALVCLIPVQLQAQSRSLSGRVTDVDGRAIARANVYIAGSFSGAMTDSSGMFSLHHSEQAPLLLVATRTGYLSDSIWLESETVTGLHLQLRQYRQLEPLVVSVAAISVGGSKRGATLQPMDIYTNAAAGGDLALGMRQLPGLQQVNDREGFFVHGGDASETTVAIEGISIRHFFDKNSPYTAARSRFPTGLFRGLSMGTGGYLASEPGGLSGALQLRLANMGNDSYSIGLMPIGLSAGLGRLSRQKRFFSEHWFNVSESSYLRLFLRPSYALHRFNGGASYTMHFTAKPSDRDEVKGMALLAYDRGSLSLEDPMPTYGRMLYDGRSRYAFAMARWQRQLDNGAMLSLATGLEYDHHRLHTAYTLASGIVLERTTQAGDVQARLSYAQTLGRIRLRTGLDYLHRYRQLTIPSVAIPRLLDHALEPYAEVTTPLGAWLGLSLGLRAMYNVELAGVDLLPRAALSARLARAHHLTVDLGRYADLDELYREYGIRPSARRASWQTNLTYEWQIARHQLLRAQVYAKRYDRLPILVSTAHAPSLVYRGAGYARGVDLLWRATALLPDLEHWISYSYTDAKRSSLYSEYQERPGYVAQHTLSLVTKYWSRPLRSLLNLTVSYRSGLPYHDPNILGAAYYNALAPARTSLDVSYNYPFRRGQLSGVFYLGAFNLLSVNTPIGYRFAQTPIGGQYTSLPILSPTRRLIMVGVFLNIGTDRRQDHMNTNLNIN